MNKKILVSLSVIGAVAAIAIGGTIAYFSDTETSTGNTFTAGAIDLKVDSRCTYNGLTSDQCGTWQLDDLDRITSNKFFNFTDVKPGDIGENTVSLHVFNNDAWACVSINPTLNDDFSSTEPELKETGEASNTDSIFDGELAQNMQFKIWADVASSDGAIAGDNKFEPGKGDILLTSGNGPITPTTWALTDSQHPNVFTGQSNSPLVGSQDYFLGVEWSIPNTVGNIIQTDKYQADISFYVVQSRNNQSFVCPTVVSPNKLRLENETIVQGGPWNIINDGIYADLTWGGDGATFNYNLSGKGLAPNTTYSLIYYADGWPGNNPGAFIGAHTTDGTGNIVGAGNPNLGIDLPTSPDGNLAIGAKIWLVLSSDYNNGNYSTGPMTAWQPDKYLFEGNVYIHYNDTDH